MPTQLTLEKETIIPLDLSLGIPIVQVNINGHGPFRMVLDTASKSMIVSDIFAKKFQLSPSPYQSFSEKNSYRWIQELQIGQATFKEFDAAVWFDVSEEIDATFDGYLGKNIFINVLLTIDYPNNRLILKPYKPLDPNDPNVVSTRAVYSQLLAIPIDIDGSPYPFVIDSSDPDAFSLRSDLRNALRFEFTPPYATLATTKRRMGHTLKLANHTFERPIATPANNVPSPLGRSRLPDPIDFSRSTVGHQFLKHFTVTFDQKLNLVRFERPQKTPIKTPPVRTYVTGRKVSLVDDTVVVGAIDDHEELKDLNIAHLFPPLKTGDLIIGLNGSHLDDLTRNDFDNILTTQSQVTLTVQRGDQTLTMTAPIITLIP